MDVTFRTLTRDDFGLIGEWFAQPLIAWWWADDPDPNAIEAEYGPVVDGTDPTEVFIVDVGGRPVGLIQRYRFDDEPQYVEELRPAVDVPSRAMSIDYLLADAAPRGAGLGTTMVQSFVDRLWADHPACPCLIVPVHSDNRPSWRTLERCGFARIAECDLTPDHPEHTPHHVVYRLERPMRDADGGLGR